LLACGGLAAVNLHHQWHDEQGHDVDQDHQHRGLAHRAIDDEDSRRLVHRTLTSPLHAGFFYGQ